MASSKSRAPRLWLLLRLLMSSFFCIAVFPEMYHFLGCYLGGVHLVKDDAQLVDGRSEELIWDQGYPF